MSESETNEREYNAHCKCKNLTLLVGKYLELKLNIMDSFQTESGF